MTSAIAGLKAHQTAMDVVGNNIANVNTYAFKGSDTSFRDTMYQTVTAASGGNSAAGVAGNNPMQVGFGATATNVTVDTTKGGEDSTGRSSDCYINGEGYYIVQDGSGVDASGNPTSYKYTRVGQLQFVDGYLTDGNGNFILGANNSAIDTTSTDATFGKGTGAVPTTTTGGGTTDGKLASDIGTGTSVTATTPATWKDQATTPVGGIVTLQKISYDTTANSLKDIKIAGDGTITATDANGKSVTIGRIGVAYFNNPGGLDEAGGSYYKSNGSSGAANAYGAGQGSTGSLITGVLESSNVDLATQLSNMIVYERGYQANTKIITVADEMLQTLGNMK